MIGHTVKLIIEKLDTSTISKERKQTLRPLVDFIQSKLNYSREIRINFICTHNSRRSHLSQVWAQTLAYHFHIKNVFCYSGGTESTALFPMVAKTLQNSGFEVKTISEGNNPVYSIKYAENEHPVRECKLNSV
ncbi:arsenate reductase [Pricia antarctica]|uniref:Arsenate reductase n=1 Tax=Pricia antarctica TaxID=641691 RepID=A0A1G7B4K2_9FLAO|nr:arsenate reductase [Pricia antarctica]